MVSAAPDEVLVRDSASAVPSDSLAKPELQAEGGAQPPHSVDDSAEPRAAGGRRRPRPPKEEDEEEEDDEDEEDKILPEAQPKHLRNEVDPKTAQFRQNVLHVYGLDFLKTSHMDEIFGQFHHKFVEWINDSAANIIFAQADSAKKALEALSFPKLNDEPWRRTPDILVSEDMPPIFLQMRLATGSDAKATKKAMPKLPEQQTWRRRGGKGRGRAPADDAGEEGGLGTKRPRPEPTEEEKERRQKRAQRFGDWLAAASSAAAAAASGVEAAAPAAAEKAAAPAPAKAPAAPVAATVTLEVTQEEMAKRRKRLERFGAPESAAAPLPEGTVLASAAGGAADEGDAGEKEAPSAAVAPSDE